MGLGGERGESDGWVEGRQPVPIGHRYNRKPWEAGQDSDGSVAMGATPRSTPVTRYSNADIWQISLKLGSARFTLGLASLQPRNR
jgi:hypothetical protein